MKLEEGAVVAIGPRARHRVEDAASRSTELGRVRVGQYLKLEDSFDAEQNGRGRPRRLVVDVVDVRTVEQEAVHLGPRAVDRNLWRAASDDIVAGSECGLHAGLQQRELLKRAPVQRKVADFSFTDETADRASCEIH